MTSPATPPVEPSEEERAEAIRLWSLSFEPGAVRASFVKDADSWDNEWLPIAESLATARSSARSAALEEGESAGLERAAAWCDGTAELYEAYRARAERGGKHEHAREMLKHFMTLADAAQHIRALKGT